MVLSMTKAAVMNAKTYNEALLALQPMQQELVQHYLICGRIGGAGRAAGYSSYASAQACWKRESVQHVIAMGKQARIDRLNMDADRVLRELLEMLEADIVDMLTPDGKAVRPVDEWPKALRGKVTSLEVTLTGSTKAKFTSNLELIKLIGSHININAFRDVISVDSANDFTKRLDAARARQAQIEHDDAVVAEQ